MKGIEDLRLYEVFEEVLKEEPKSSMDENLTGVAEYLFQCQFEELVESELLIMMHLHNELGDKLPTDEKFKKEFFEVLTAVIIRYSSLVNKVSAYWITHNMGDLAKVVDSSAEIWVMPDSVIRPNKSVREASEMWNQLISSRELFPVKRTELNKIASETALDVWNYE